MQFGRVIGSVVSTQKDEKLVAFKLLVVRTLNAAGADTSSYVVAVDAVGAGTGEVVLYATGSSARQTKQTDAKPVDAVIMAIVDSWDIDGKVVFRKE